MAKGKKLKKVLLIILAIAIVVGAVFSVRSSVNHKRDLEERTQARLDVEAGVMEPWEYYKKYVKPSADDEEAMEAIKAIYALRGSSAGGSAPAGGSEVIDPNGDGDITDPDDINDIDNPGDTDNPDGTDTTGGSGGTDVTSSSGGGTTPTAAQGDTVPAGKAQILKAYTEVMDNAKKAKPGYKKLEFQELPEDKRDIRKGGGAVKTLLSVASNFMTDEASARSDGEFVNGNEKGGNMKWFPVNQHSTKGCLLTDTSKIKSATSQKLSNGNYKLTIILEKDVNPEPYKPGAGDSPNATGSVSKGFVGKMFSPLSAAEIDDTIKNNSLVNAFVKDVSYKLTYHDCKAVLEYNPKTKQIVNLDQYMYVTIYAQCKVIGMSVDLTCELVNTMKCSDFKY